MASTTEATSFVPQSAIKPNERGNMTYAELTIHTPHAPISK